MLAKTRATGPKNLHKGHNAKPFLCLVVLVLPKKGANQRERAKIDGKQKEFGTAPSLPTPAFDCLDCLLHSWGFVTLGVCLLKLCQLRRFLRDKGFESEITDSLKGMVGFFFLLKMHFGKKRPRNILAASESYSRINAR